MGHIIVLWEYMGYDGVRFKGYLSELLFQTKLFHHVASGLNISRAAAPQTSPSMTYLQLGPWQRHTHESSLLTKPTTSESFSGVAFTSQVASNVACGLQCPVSTMSSMSSP